MALAINDNVTIGLCQCCLNNLCTTDIWTEQTWMDEKVIYVKMLRDCFDIKMVKDTSMRICEVCTSQLRTAWSFKRQVLVCQKRLAEELNKKEAMNNLLEAKDESDCDNSADMNNDDSVELSENGGIDSIVNLTKIDNSQETVRCQLQKNITMMKNWKKSREIGIIGRVKAPLNSLRIKRKTLKRPQNSTKENIALLLNSSTICPFKSVQGQFSCFYCEKPFIVFDELRKHTFDIHSTVNDLKSIGKSEENAINADLSDIKCKVCDKKCESVEILVGHLTEQHEVEFNNSASLKTWECITGYDLSNGEYSCTICKRNFDFFRSLTTHMNDHSRSNVCDVCGKCFLYRKRLEAHSKLHDNQNHKCEICTKIFRSILILNSHKRYAHTPKVHQCKYCRKSFKSYALRLQHLVQEHRIKKPDVSCNICSKEFAHSSSLKYHMRKHMKRQDELVRCDQCDKVLRKRTFKLHKIIHTGEKNHECKYCHRKYGRAKTLKEHLKIHLNDKRFSCGSCGQAFIQKCSLKNHIRVHHPGGDIDKLIIHKKF